LVLFPTAQSPTGSPVNLRPPLPLRAVSGCVSVCVCVCAHARVCLWEGGCVGGWVCGWVLVYHSLAANFSGAVEHLMTWVWQEVRSFACSCELGGSNIKICVI
jgi:hypothetical protein